MGKDKVQEFPDVDTKLGAPTKKSVFERQKAEAEAKRLKEQQETAAVYQDFVKSFDDDSDDGFPPAQSRGFGPPPGGGLGGGFSKRHFTAGPPARGGRGSGPGSLGPPSLTKKRAHDGGPPLKDGARGMFAFEESAGPLSAKAAFQTSDDEDEKPGISSRAQERAAQKPTLHLSSLPPGTTHAAIKSIIPSNVKVDGVRMLPPSNAAPGERRGLSAIVTAAADTPAGDLDSVVSSLQKKYLGKGFYLTLSRHLSSAVVGNLPTGSTTATLPFGARPAQIPATRGGFSQRGGRGNFAPPPSYGTHSGFGRPPPVHVTVAPPTDLKQLKLIHKTVESLVKHGPEFEALLMSRSEVQRDEKWAWLWDPTSTGGVWYRWRLWDILTSAKARSKKTKRGANDGQSQIVFDGGAPWTAPERGVLPFEYATGVDEFVSASDYNSSSDDDSGDEGRRRMAQLQPGALSQSTNPADAAAADEVAYLNPLHKAKLVHLLARLPDTTAKLRRGDVARVTAFAIQHAGEGAEEVAALLVRNVARPFALTAATGTTATKKRTGDAGSANVDDTNMTPSAEGTGSDPNPTGTPAASETDPSQFTLISLYLISDILSSSSTSGVRHAWRYRALFEQQLRAQHTFAHLGRVEKELRWGRLRAEKWRRSVHAVLGLWEGWCVFPAAAQEAMRAEFEKPPPTREEAAREAEAERLEGKARGGKWKSVKERRAEAVAVERGEGVGVGTKGGEGDGGVDGEELIDEDLDGEPMEDVDGEPMEEDEDDDVDGEPMEEDDVEESKHMAAGEAEDEAASGKVDAQPQHEGGETHATGQASVPGVKKRPRAVDMFGDSDDE